jgi:hypothetical protein
MDMRAFIATRLKDLGSTLAALSAARPVLESEQAIAERDIDITTTENTNKTSQVIEHALSSRKSHPKETVIRTSTTTMSPPLRKDVAKRLVFEVGTEAAPTLPSVSLDAHPSTSTVAEDEEEKERNTKRKTENKRPVLTASAPSTPVGTYKSLSSRMSQLTPRTLVYVTETKKFVEKHGEDELRKRAPSLKSGEPMESYRRRMLHFYSIYDCMIASERYGEMFGKEAIQKDRPPQMKDESKSAWMQRVFEFYTRRCDTQMAMIHRSSAKPLPDSKKVKTSSVVDATSAAVGKQVQQPSKTPRISIEIGQ